MAKLKRVVPSPKFVHALTLSKRDFNTIPAEGALTLAVDTDGRWWVAERIPGGPEPQFIPVEAFWYGERGHVIGTKN
jgi:hypothetical protein